MLMNSSIVVVGSLNADLVVRVGRFPVPGETIAGHDFHIYPGGKGANQAYAAARLGGNVAMVGQVGNDAHAAWLRENLARAGVNVDNSALPTHQSPAASPRSRSIPPVKTRSSSFPARTEPFSRNGSRAAA